ncbi:MAG: hypothetical protein J5501_09890 [Ruminococcus sp.]|nr:hypothetical protein [Ruminococcus sp.]
MADFSNFLTDEDIFNLEFEKYIPEFIERAANDTLDAEGEFADRTRALMELGAKAGIDLQQHILQYVSDNNLS